MAAQRARKFALLAGQSAAGGEVIDQLHDDVHRLAVTYPQQPLATVLGGLVDTQDSIFTLLEARQRPQRARQLYFLGAVVGGLLAKASHDLADPHAAMAQARTAFLCADNADHDGLRAWLRGQQSLIAYWAGRPREAARYAESGGQYAAGAGNTTAVWLPMNEARAWAALGDAERTRAAIERAEHAWDTVHSDDLDELGGICTFSRPRQLYYAADALVWLPAEASHAERYSTAAVEAYGDTADPDWAFGDQAGSHTALAIARVAHGEFDGAAEALAPVLALPAEQRINGIVASARRVHQVLSRAPGAAGVSDLREEIEVFMTIPMNALPR
ncbi:MAG: XRE family transcriptional regulator [Dactylosporangium sp.]|nr:XRE family transcriptional regulator [Dactylosporangium sp.]NNJ62545.1 XRE family transcriptional regulator [Dactylosporangium sp.]